MLFSTIVQPAFGQSFGDWYRQSSEPREYLGSRYRYGPPDDRARSYRSDRENHRYWLDEDEPPRYRSDVVRRHWDEDEPLARASDRGYGPAILDGRRRHEVRPILPTQIAFGSSYLHGSVVIDTAGRRLYLVRSPTSALVYQISLGRERFAWVGTQTISRIADWPDWHPPAEMRQRDPRLPRKNDGGLRNRPLALAHAASVSAGDSVLLWTKVAIRSD